MNFIRNRFRTAGFALLALCLLSFAHGASAASPVVHISRNWAGYGVSGGTYTGVSATWTVPRSLPTSSTLSADAAWVGIGGLATKDLIQAGTQVVFVNGQPRYQAWYETLPDAQQIVPLALSAGDTVSVSLAERRTGIWHVTIANLTTGRTYETDIAYASSHASAEWVLERPLAVTSAGSSYLPLNAFGTLQFRDARVIEDGAAESLEASGAEPLYMGNDRLILATASEAQGGQFSVRYLSPYEGRIAMRELEDAYSTIPYAQQARMPVTTVETSDTTIIIRISF